ncbi:MAG: helix-turn-helix transcriptional regulator [Bacteroidetes bacterium]|nr:helix-turn-helix transcriptional regulator [Bacteroidota bacterium]MBK9049190.1 helix-turn-helix transcriptional regulator [Bacteroidota bacterium]MBK9423442.1 helix-turn-helix transcriptional regulator [Bacteroidota bacterium]
MRIKDKEVVIKLKGQTYHCAMDVTMDFIGGKWKTIVLWYLRNDKKRFAEIRKLVPQMTERMLSITLKQLEADGLIIRKVHASKPPLKVEYSLSEFGKTLIPLLNAISKWGRELAETEGKIVEVK